MVQVHSLDPHKVGEIRELAGKPQRDKVRGSSGPASLKLQETAFPFFQVLPVAAPVLQCSAGSPPPLRQRCAAMVSLPSILPCTRPSLRPARSWRL